MISPEHGRDATIETHAVVTALLMLLGGNHPLVTQGVGHGAPPTIDPKLPPRPVAGRGGEEKRDKKIGAHINGI
jgi:hypothetical protein